MAAVPSTMLEIGTRAPDFQLPDPDGKRYALSDFQDSKGLLVVFMCNHCPFVKHVAGELAAIARQYGPDGIAMVGINSNDFGKYPDDSPAKMKEEVKARGYTFPYLVDEDQSVARAYRAACTPDFYLFDADRKLIYRGQLDDSRPSTDTPVTGSDLRAAMDALLTGRPVSSTQIPSIGCNIKWKPGNEPDYFG